MNEMQRQAMDRVGETGEALLRVTPSASTPVAPGEGAIDDVIQIVRNIYGGVTDGGSDVEAHAYRRAQARKSILAALSHPAPVAAQTVYSDDVEQLIDQCAQDWHDWQKQGNDEDRAAWLDSRRAAIDYFLRHAAPVAAPAPREAIEAACFRWLLENRISEDGNGWLQITYGTARQGEHHPEESRAHWLTTDIAGEMGLEVGEATAAPAPASEAVAQSITIDFKQATELLEMFGDAPSEITLSHYPNDVHHFEEGFTVAAGLYAHYTEIPEEGSTFLGVSDDEALPATSTTGEAEPKPMAWLHYAPKKPSLRRVDFHPAPSVIEKASGWVSIALGPVVTPSAATPVAPGEVTVPKGWRIEREPANVLALHRTGTAQPHRFAPGEVVHALLADMLGGCPECGGRMEYEDGEPWDGPSVGCVECGVVALSHPAPVAAPAPDGDDSFLLCVSDLQHSAIYDSPKEMHACIRAVAERIEALAAPAPASEAVAYREALEKIAELPVRHIETGRIARAALKGIRHTPSTGDSADAPVQQAGEVTEAQILQAMPPHHRRRTSLENVADVRAALAALKGEPPAEPSGSER